MNIDAAISTVMIANFPTLEPNDSLMIVQNLFNEWDISNIPVLKKDKLVGIVSKVDFLFYTKGKIHYNNHVTIEIDELKTTDVNAILRKNLPALSPKDSIQQALAIFEKHRFQCLPVIENGKLVGLLTPLDISKVFL